MNSNNLEKRNIIRRRHLMQVANWVKVSERLPNDYEVVLTKNNGANAREVFIYDEQKTPTFIHFSRNGKSRILSNITEWCSPPMPEGE